MGNFYMEATQINYRRDDKLKTVDQKLQELSETSAIDTDIAPVFKSTNTYQPGDMVYYRNKLYVFNVEHTGAWAAADVTATDVTTELSSLKSGLTNVQSDVKLNTQDLTTGSRTKNLAPFTLENLKKWNTAGTWDGNSYTNEGITWTVGYDSNGNISTITANGTATNTTNFETRLSIKPGTYILSGAPADTPESSYYMQMYHYPETDKKDRGSGVTVTIANEVNVRIRAIIPNAYEVTNVVFKPMVRLSTITDATYAPYIPSVESRIEAVESGLTNLVKEYSGGSVTSDSNGVLTTDISVSHHILGAVFCNCILLPFINTNTNKWSIMVADIDGSGNIVAQANKTATLYAYYI